MGRQKNNMWLKVDSGARDTEFLGGFGDGVLFSHASLYRKRLCREWRGSMQPRLFGSCPGHCMDTMMKNRFRLG
jgi:hypothetical protein